MTLSHCLSIVTALIMQAIWSSGEGYTFLALCKQSNFGLLDNNISGKNVL